MKNKKILGVAALVILVAILGFCYLQFREKPVEGSKEITIEVIDDKEKSKTYELKTDAEFLKQAMDEVKELSYSGTEGDYGLMINTVNDVVADYNTNGAFWSFYVNETYCNYGVSEQPVNDGDAFQIIYTVEQ